MEETKVVHALTALIAISMLAWLAVEIYQAINAKVKR